MKHLAHTIALDKKQTLFAVIVVDIDLFQRINENYSYDFGNKILILVARKLQKNFKFNGYIAHLMGNEFVVVLRNYDDDQRLVSLVEAMYKNFEVPFILDEYANIRMTISSGVCQYPKDANCSDKLL